MNNIPEIISNIYQEFIDYFGEANVDLQMVSLNNNIKLSTTHAHNGDYLILTYWKEVTITNEYDESIDIWDLYSATIISPTGTIKTGPLFVRSSYDTVQWKHSYCHSHVPSLDKHFPRTFQKSCLGSGPINGTIDLLRAPQSADLDVWRLYCWELDKYVHVESLTGGPYRRLRDIGKDAKGEGDSFNLRFTFPFPASSVCKVMTNTLIRVLLENNVLKYSYSNGRYYIAESYTDTVLAISNAFIEHYNSNTKLQKSVGVEDLYRHYFIEKAFIQGGKLIKEVDSNNEEPMNIGIPLFTFKGETVTLQLHTTDNDYNVGELRIVNTKILDYIIYVILKCLNINYGKPTDTTHKETRIL